MERTVKAGDLVKINWASDSREEVLNFLEGQAMDKTIGLHDLNTFEVESVNFGTVNLKGVPFKVNETNLIIA